MAKSVLHYELDKVSYLVLETVSIPVLVSQIFNSFCFKLMSILFSFSKLQEVVGVVGVVKLILWNGCSHSKHVFETNTHSHYSMKYWRNGGID